MQTNVVPENAVLNLKVGELVEVRTANEITATLDKNGELDSLPFMPEMLAFCGRTFTVDKVAHKLCDTMTRTGMRRMERAVHLSGVRCDGDSHGGCQARCRIYWKEAWLKRADGSADPVRPLEVSSARLLPLLITASTRPPADDGPRYACQATELLRAAPELLPLRQPWQYIRDIESGNVSPFFAIRALLVGVFNRLQGHTRRLLARRFWFRHGLDWGLLHGVAGRTPTLHTDLQPGELVRIKSKQEIMSTLDRSRLNRGLGFDTEMSRFCGRTARVSHRVDRIIDEKSGRLIEMRNPCIVLDGVICEGAFNASCPRGITPYWREIWLTRVTDPT